MDTQQEYAEAAVATGNDMRTVDSKGRLNIHAMTDREIAEETLKALRDFADGLEKFYAEMSKNPMIGPFLPKV